MERMAGSSKGNEKPSGRARTLPWWAKWLVAFHVFAITVWSLPPPAPAIVNGSVKPAINTGSASEFARSLVPFIHDHILLFAYRVKYPNLQDAGPTRLAGQATRGYLLSTGMWQYWDMFAPNPSNLDLWVDAEVLFQNGSRRVYAYPRIAKLPIPLKYVQERFRKFAERAHSEEFHYAWPAFAQRIALSAFDDPADPPVQVVLRRHFREILPPDQVTPTAYTAYAYYRHTVNLEALRRDAGVR